MEREREEGRFSGGSDLGVCWWLWVRVVRLKGGGARSGRWRRWIDHAGEAVVLSVVGMGMLFLVLPLLLIAIWRLLSLLGRYIAGTGMLRWT